MVRKNEELLPFVMLSWGSMSASSGSAGNLCLSVLILPNLGSKFPKDRAGSKFHVFLKLKMPEFSRFCGFLSEFSAWSYELK